MRSDFLFISKILHIDADAQRISPSSGHFLFYPHIGTAEELSAFREETIQKIHVLVQERNGIYNKIRRAAEPEKTELKARARAVSQQIAPLRKELKSADRIWDRSLDTVKNLLDQERQLEVQVMNRYKERSYER